MYDDDLDLLESEGSWEQSPSVSDSFAPESVQPKPDPEQMLPLLRAVNPQQRMLAARSFCELQDERAIPFLINLLHDSCPLIRVSAAYALGRNPSVDAVEPLIHQLQSDWNGYARKGIVWALGNCRDPRSLMPLINALKTDISAVRLWAASSLAQMAAISYESVISAIPPLIEALRQDPIPAVRSNCAWAIGQLCRELPSNVVYATAVDALIESLVEDPDMGVRDDARASLLRVGDPRSLQLIAELEQEGLV
jgi:HEAT repeat protein